MKPLEFTCINESGAVIPTELLRVCAETVIGTELAQREAEVAVLICGDDAMRKFNRQYRGDNAVTDVLCFNLEEGGTGTLERLACDIIIDINQLDRQRGTKTLETELIEVLTHGLLHACGYDHIRPGDLVQMSAREIYYKQLREGAQQRG